MWNPQPQPEGGTEGRLDASWGPAKSPAGLGGVGVPGLGGSPWVPLSFTCMVIPRASVPRGLWDLSSPTGD